MLMKTMGFNLQGCLGAHLNLFFHSLTSETYKDDDVIIRFIDRDDYWIGVVVSIRNQKSICKMQAYGDAFTITMQQLQANENPVEFNVFLIRKSSLRGIYLHYFHSRSLNNSLKILGKLYKQFKQSCLNTELNAITTEGKLQKDIAIEKKLIKQKYVEGLTYNIWVKPGSFESMIENMRSITNFEVEFEQVVVNDNIFRPVAELSKSVKHRFSFVSAAAPLTSLKTSVTNVISNLNTSLLNAKVKGIDPEGLDVIYSLENNVDYLSTYDYDDIVAGLEIQSTDIEGSLLHSRLITQMVAVAQSPVVRSVLNSVQ